MVSFGVPGLDDALAGHNAGPILIENEPGVDGRPFLLQAAARALVAGQAVAYLTTDRPPSRVLDGLDAYGPPPVGRLKVFDGYSALQGIKDASHRPVELRDIDRLITQLEKAQGARDSLLFVLDSLNGLAVRAGPRQLMGAAPRFQALLGGFDQSLVSFTRWDSQLDPLLNAFPSRVRLNAVQDRIVTSQYFRVERVHGRQQPRARPILYRSDGGPVRVYVPKLLVTGPADAGKSTFVHAVSDHAVSADRAGATVALDRGTLARHGIQVQIFGTPGQERFDPMIGPILRQAVGVVLVVDSTQPESFQRGSQMLRMAWRQGLHAVVAANKQDLDGALELAAVQERLELPDGVPVVGCKATDPASAMEVLDGLLRRILNPTEVVA